MTTRPNCAGIWRGNEKRDECRVSRDNRGESVEGRVATVEDGGNDVVEQGGEIQARV